MVKRRYETQLARDLHWALDSPMLFEDPRVVDPLWGQRETARYGGLLRKLDDRRSALAKAVRNAEVDRLGPYFEVLLRTWIDEVSPARLAASNWQVWAGRHTIGEYDLIFYRDGRPWHWELAVKFYLGHPARDGRFRWYGPNPVDRLDRKWAKMRGQQLRLSEHPAGRGALEVLGVDDEVTPRAFIKGYLFEPLSDRFDVAYPIDVNPLGLRGWWVHHGELARRREQIELGRQLEWVILPEMRWLSPAFVGDSDRICSFEALAAVVPEYRPTLVAGLGLRDGRRAEVTRGFVVPDGWPNL